MLHKENDTVANTYQFCCHFPRFIIVEVEVKLYSLSLLLMIFSPDHIVSDSEL